MASTSTVWIRVLPSYRVSLAALAQVPLLVLFLWYIFYPGLSRVIPLYDQIDDLIFVSLAGLGLARLILRKGRLNIRSDVIIFLLLITSSIALSGLYNHSNISAAVNYAYLVLRPFFVLLYIASWDTDIRTLFSKIVFISRVLVLINLPSILYKIITVNLKVLQPQYNDAIHGFFPFQNNDALAWLYAILLLKDAYDVLIENRKRSIWLFIGEYILLLFTMNTKYILLVSFSLVAIVFFRSRNRLRNALLLMIFAIFPAMLLYPVVQPRISAIQLSPVYITSELILTGQVEEYNPLLGTGLGAFTSPAAFENDSFLAKKYGLFERKYYWEEVFTGASGTLTRSTSSVLTLLGDAGGFALCTFIAFFVWYTVACFRRVQYSFIYMTGFVFGLYTFIAGFFLDIWFWGLEIFLFMLSVKLVSEIKIRTSIHLV